MALHNRARLGWLPTKHFVNIKDRSAVAVIRASDGIMVRHRDEARPQINKGHDRRLGEQRNRAQRGHRRTGRIGLIDQFHARGSNIGIGNLPDH